MIKFAGGKFTGSHTTVIEAAEDLMKMLNRSELVKKIVIGIIKQKVGKNASQARYKIQPNGAGLKLVVNGSKTVQEFYIYTDDQPALEAEIAAIWVKSSGKKGHK